MRCVSTGRSSTTQLQIQYAEIGMVWRHLLSAFAGNAATEQLVGDQKATLTADRFRLKDKQRSPGERLTTFVFSEQR